MNPLIRRLALEASAPVEDMIARLIKTAALVALAAGCAIAASVFLTIDLYLFIESLKGPVIAAASIAGFYVVAAAIFLLFALRRPRPAAAVVTAPAPPPVAAPFKAASLGAEAAAPAQPRNPAFAANIDSTVAPVLDVLRDAGLEKEVIAIEAAAEVAKQLNPFALVAFAAGAGIFVGRSLRSGRKLF